MPGAGDQLPEIGLIDVRRDWAESYRLAAGVLMDMAVTIEVEIVDASDPTVRDRLLTYSELALGVVFGDDMPTPDEIQQIVDATLDSVEEGSKRLISIRSATPPTHALSMLANTARMLRETWGIDGELLV